MAEIKRETYIGKDGLTKTKGGRPKAGHTLQAEKMRAALVKLVAKEQKALFKAKLDLALGHWAEELDPKTGTRLRIYKTKPDGPAQDFLFNQTIGKAKETTLIEGHVTLIMDGWG